MALRPWLLGLPVADDLDGRVLEELIEPGFLESHPGQTIASFEPLVRSAGPDLLGSGPGGQEKIELLRSLGYLVDEVEAEEVSTAQIGPTEPDP